MFTTRNTPKCRSPSIYLNCCINKHIKINSFILLSKIAMIHVYIPHTIMWNITMSIDSRRYFWKILMIYDYQIELDSFSDRQSAIGKINCDLHYSMGTVKRRTILVLFSNACSSLNSKRCSHIIFNISRYFNDKSFVHLNIHC